MENTRNPNTVKSLGGLGNLGLCKKAGRIITGFDAVVEEMKNPVKSTKIAGIITSSDLSEKSKKEIAFYCNKHTKKCVEINHTMAEIESIIGKKTGIIAILDQGFYQLLTKNY